MGGWEAPASLSEITALFPTTYEAYHEPFVGGGAVFLIRILIMERSTI